jgi:hypothetical protein
MQEIEHRGFMVVGLCGFICGMPMCSGMCARADACKRVFAPRVCVCGTHMCVCVCGTRV